MDDRQFKVPPFLQEMVEITLMGATEWEDAIICMFCSATTKDIKFYKAEVKVNIWEESYIQYGGISCCEKCLPLFEDYVNNGDAPLIKEPEED